MINVKLRHLRKDEISIQCEKARQLVIMGVLAAFDVNGQKLQCCVSVDIVNMLHFCHCD